MVKKSLKKYTLMRDFSKTQEPEGAVGLNKKNKRTRLSFTVQKHHARNLHYDFRLEMDGVLRSWAVPKGPSLNPRQRRLAVQVEDHPLEYGDFEGEIPKGEYGAGSVIVWDKGFWEPIGDLKKSYRLGKLKFYLFGTRLKGAWTLVQMKNDDGRLSKNWLLIKDRDKEAQTDSDVLDLFTDSVLLTKQGRMEAKANFAENVKPQLATLSKNVPEGKTWLHEVKFDGYRLLIIKDGDSISLRTRGGKDLSSKLKPLTEHIRKIDASSVILDGELVSLDEKGHSDFQQLQNDLNSGDLSSLHYYAFDILFLNGKSFVDLQLIKRKGILEKFLCRSTNNTIIHYSQHFCGDGPAFFEEVCKQGIEGIISKKIDSTHDGARSKNWLKQKCTHRQEFVIGGYTGSSNSTNGFGSLLLGYFDNGRLLYCGRVGTGFTQQSVGEVSGHLKSLKRQRSPFFKGPNAKVSIGVFWLKPSLVCEVKFSEWTQSKRLRHPAFLGLRADKIASEIILESSGLEAKKVTALKVDHLESEAGNPNPQFIGVTLTHPNRILFPKEAISKEDLAKYYAKVVDHIMPYIRDRPLALVRCPKGQSEECFFQKHFSGQVPEELDTVQVDKKKKKEALVVVNQGSALMRLVQLGVLELHIWGSTSDQVDRPDTLVFDLDPGDGLTMSQLVRAARIVRQYLSSLRLVSFLKISGGKGLHIVVPIQRGPSWDEVKSFSKGLCALIARDHSDIFVCKMTKKLRQGKVYFDYLRNTRGATSIAPFSTRARENATVALPLSWKQLRSTLSPKQFTIKTVPAILSRRKTDPWADFFQLRQSLPDITDKKKDL